MEIDSGISGPPVTSRPDEGMPTATVPMAAKTKMVICDPSHADPAKSKGIDKVVSHTNIPGAPVSHIQTRTAN